jgi:LmbE family N-acetylglucosaminyl deacetylase
MGEPAAVNIPERKIALSLMAHPDDAEFLCAGTLALLRQRGWDIHIATMAPGDKGSATHTREEISEIRRAEAARSAALLDGQYHCLECEDIYILYDRETINRATALLRRVKPSLVFTASPSDYMVDHDMTGKVAQTACFCCGVKNMEVEEQAFEPVPWLYYADPVECKDRFGQPVAPGMWVDIAEAMETKEAMLRCHASQREWLMAHHGIDEYILMMKESSAKRGQGIGAAFAEGFRQHLGHAYPQENLLKKVLADSVTERKNTAFGE